MPSNKPADFCVPSLMAQPHPKLGSTDNSLSRMGVHCLRSRVRCSSPVGGAIPVFSSVHRRFSDEGDSLSRICAP